MNMWRESILRDRTCKASEVGTSLTCLKKSSEALVARESVFRGRDQKRKTDMYVIQIKKSIVGQDKGMGLHGQ